MRGQLLILTDETFHQAQHPCEYEIYTGVHAYLLNEYCLAIMVIAWNS